MADIDSGQGPAFNAIDSCYLRNTKLQQNLKSPFGSDGSCANNSAGIAIIY